LQGAIGAPEKHLTGWLSGNNVISVITEIWEIYRIQVLTGPCAVAQARPVHEGEIE
jgi:hypothetical protein